MQLSDYGLLNGSLRPSSTNMLNEIESYLALIKLPN